MSGTQVSSFGNASQNALFDPLMARRQTQYDTNDLLSKQAIGAGDTEMAARIAQSLVATGDEAKAAQLYPGMIAEAQGRGFLKNAPAVWPGMEHAKRVAALGVPAEKQYERGLAGQDAAGVGRRWGAAGGAPGTTAAAPAGGGGGGSVAAGEIEPPARDRALAIRDGLVKRGMDVETATAFAANALHESAANPNTGPGDAGASHGLFQWNQDRLAAYRAKFGRTPDNAPLDEQLDFVMHELNGSESLAKGRIAQAQGVDGKAAEISNAYLRPKDTGPEMQRRAATALKLAGGWSQPVTAPQSDQAWLDNQAKTYPAMAGPNVNMQAGTQPPVAPAGGGRVQVASVTPTTMTDATPAPVAPPGAATAAQPAATTQQPSPPPQVTIPPPPALLGNGLTREQNAEIPALQEAVRRGQMKAPEADAKLLAYQKENVAAQRQYQLDVQAQQDRQQVAADRAETLRLSRESGQRAADDAAQKAKDAALPFHGNAADVQNRNILIEGTKSGKTDTVEYGSAWADYATEKKDAEGRTFKPDMSPYATPAGKTYGERGGRDLGKADVSQAALAPVAMNTAMLGNQAALRNIDNALKELNAHPDSVGLKAVQPDWLIQRTDPEGVTLRADIADILSQTFHDRSGAAVTVSEAPRMQPFVPSQKDSANALRTKLERMRGVITGVLNDHYDVYGPKGGFRAISGVEDALKATAPKASEFTEGQTATGADGHKLVFRNGKWGPL